MLCEIQHPPTDERACFWQNTKPDAFTTSGSNLTANSRKSQGLPDVDEGVTMCVSEGVSTRV